MRLAHAGAERERGPGYSARVTDSRLRALERRWKETGTVQDEAAYLVERVRVGDLERSKLELAAVCRHEAAVSVCPEVRSVELRQGPAVDWTLLERSEEIGWFREVQRLGGGDALIRAVAAAFNVSPWAHADTPTPHTLLREQVDAAALSPREAHFTAMRCHRGSDWGHTRIIARWLDEWTAGAHSAPLRSMVCLGLLAPTAEQWLTMAEAVRLELASWLLGYADPVRERVEARREPSDG